MKVITLITILMTGCAFGGLEVSRVVRGTQKPGDLVVTNVTISGYVETNQTITIGTETKPVVGNVTFPASTGINAGTATNIAQAISDAKVNIAMADVVTGQQSNTLVTVFGWGNHAGLYRLIDWVPGWDDVTNKPTTFTPSSHTHEHTALGALNWTDSGHTGTPARIAGFFEGGAAGYAGLGAGLYLDGSDNISMSNDVITGAALGTTSVQTELDPTVDGKILIHATNEVLHTTGEERSSWNGKAEITITNDMASMFALTNLQHNTLLGRSTADAHPTNAITGLSEFMATPFITNNQPIVITFTNGTTIADGVKDGTNGVFFTKGGTNFWILLP